MTETSETSTRRLPSRFTVRLNGVSHAPGYPARAHSIAAEGPIPATLVRRPMPGIDMNAIEVHAAGTLIGWIERSTAKVIAPALDDGATYRATVDVTVNENHPSRPAVTCHVEATDTPHRTTHQDNLLRHIPEFAATPDIGLVLATYARIADTYPTGAETVRPTDISTATGLPLRVVNRACNTLGAAGLIERHGRNWMPVTEPENTEDKTEATEAPTAA